MILFVAVTYRTLPQAIRFANEISRSAGSHEVRVVVVDNSPDAPDTADVPENERVVYLHAGRNLGYFAGAALGLATYLESRPAPEWVVVSNVDLQVDAAQIATALRSLEHDSSIGVVAPDVTSANSDRALNPFMQRRPTALRMHAYKWLFRWSITLHAYNFLSEVWFRHPMRWLRTLGLKGPRRTTEASDIYAPHGCFMIFSRHYFSRGGTLKHGIFLYGEEVTAAEACRSLDLRVRYEPAMKIVHLDTQSTSRRISASVRRYMAEAARYCADVYFPMRPRRSRSSVVK